MTKRLLSLLLLLAVCLGCFAACSDEAETSADTSSQTSDVSTEEVATLDMAVAVLHNMYKNAAKNTPVDYDVVAQIMVGTTKFPVTWTVDNQLISVKKSVTDGFWTVDLPAKTEEELSYKLTATVKDAAGKTMSKTYDRIVPIVDNTDLVTLPEEGVAYKLYLIQANLGQTLYATLETQSDNKYIVSTTDPKSAPDFFVEKDGDGFKFYTEADGVKTYVYAKTVASEDGKVSKYLGYGETGTVWHYRAAENAWFTTIDGSEYVLGTYNSYSTFSISDAYHMTPETTGVSQFPGVLILKENAESKAPAEEVTVYETPEEIVNAAHALENGMVLSAGHTYTLTGQIISVDSAYSDQYSNVTVTIVVGDMEDKPIQCFRLKGDGADVIGAGDIITVSGILKNYNGTIEFDAGCTLDSYEEGSIEVTIYETAEDIVNAAYELASGATLSAGHRYTLTGVITSVDTEYSADYGNVTVSIVVDGMTDKPIVCFRLKGDGADKIGVGDTITVTGPIKNYGGTIEFDSSCTLDEYTLTDKPPVDDPGEDPGEDPVEPPKDDPVIYNTPAEIMKAAYELAKDTKLSDGHKYTLTGEITSVDASYSATYKNVTVTIKVDGTDKTIQCYRLKGTGADTIKVGDTITVEGSIINYNGKVQFDAGCALKSVTPGEDPGEDPVDPPKDDPVIYNTPAEIMKAAYELAKDTKLSDGHKYTLTGEITSVDTVYNTSFKNVTVTIKVAGTDKSIQCYRLAGTGADTIKVGDTITVEGSIINYNGKVQFDAGCALKSVVPGEEPEDPPVDTPTYDTPEEIVNGAYALENGKFLADGQQFTLTGEITMIQTAYDSSYKNVSVIIVVEGMSDKPILCYRLKGTGADKIKIGDTITVTGKLKNYNGTIEFDTGCNLDSYKVGTVEVEIYDTPKEIVEAAYKLDKGETLSAGHKYTLTGKITKINTAYSSQYKNITVTIVIEGCEDKPIVCYRLKGTGADALKVGDTITVSGTIVNYNGTIEFNSGCTFTK